MRLKGIKTVNKNIRRAMSGVRANVRGGVIESLKLVKREAVNETPVEHGDLKRSAYRKVATDKSSTYGIVGFNTVYANKVHFSPGTLFGVPRPSGIGTYWSPNGQPLFLQHALTSNEAKITNIIISAASKMPIKYL